MSTPTHPANGCERYVPDESGVVFVDPIQSTNTFEWQCTRCGDYIISRSRPACENCDGMRGGRDIVPLQPHERRRDG